MSDLLDECVHHHLLAGLVEADVEPVVFDRAHRAISEFLMEDAIALGEAADAAHLDPALRHGPRFDDGGAATERSKAGEVGSGKLGPRPRHRPILALEDASARIKAGIGDDIGVLA